MSTFFESRGVKAVFVGFLVILLLIPLLFVANLVSERKQRKENVQAEITNQWSLNQRINGPYLKVPVEFYQKNETALENKITKSNLYFSPSDLEITGMVNPVKRKRGIYEVVLYDADLKIKGNFNKFLFEDPNVKAIKWDEAELLFGITDMRGLNEKVIFQIGDKLVELGNSDSVGFLKSKITGINESKKNLTFTTNLKFRGSESLDFTPSSSNTKINIKSPWKSPSFYGAFLPINHKVETAGFEANWNVLELNRNIQKVVFAIESNSKFQNEYNFGVRFLEVNDNYQKNERAVKYGILIIALTFLSFFFTELWLNKKIIFIHYGLVGFALVIFYCLLLSFSEFISFNPAYLVSSFMTIVLLFLFTKSIFEITKPAIFVSGIISLLYLFIFVIIQLEDTALLIGSLGLFIILAITMWVSKKINLNVNLVEE